MGDSRKKFQLEEYNSKLLYGDEAAQVSEILMGTSPSFNVSFYASRIFLFFFKQSLYHQTKKKKKRK